LEFDDLLHRAYRLLTDPRHKALRKRLTAGARQLLVDEFQDTNPLQVSIIQAFCGEGWQQRGLFTVGDFKQSIYRFNGAEPRVSTSLRESLPAGGRLSLTRNFRSQPAITDFINAVFHDAFAEYEPLAPDRSQLTPAPAVEFLWSPCDDGNCDDDHAEEGAGAAAVNKRRRGAAREARATEARWIARRLVQLLQSPDEIVVEKVDGHMRPRRLRLGDIAILLRTLSDAQVYEEALRAHGLDYHLAGGHAFYSQQEIYDILNLLRAVASSVDEIALAAALRSPLFSLEDETLFWLVQKSGSLNAALEAGRPPDVLSAEEAAKVRRADATLARLRLEKDRLLVADLLALALELTGYDAVLLTEFLGQRKAANIEKLVEQARTLDRSSPGDLQGFISQLSEFVVRAPKEALAATQAEGDVIRIMTIHYAKGLEFPLVVLPDLDRQRHLGMMHPVLHGELGPLVPVEVEGKTVGAGMDLYRRVENLEDLEERKRLFYVACTRAADYLLLSSSMDDPAKPKRDWLQLVNRTIDLADGTLKRPLPPGYAAPHVRVTAAIPKIDDETVAIPRGADLNRLVAKTRELAAKSAGELPSGANPIPVDGHARRRFSFSRLSGQLAAQAPGQVQWPDAAGAFQLSGSESGPLEFGSLVHAVLQGIDFGAPSELKETCEFFAPQFMTANWDLAAAEAAELVARFIGSPRGRDLANAGILRREVEFFLPWAREENHESPDRFFQGFLDCVYQGQDGRWRLLDYKTNRVPIERVPETAECYELQMLVYATACERALGQPLAECAIVFLAPGVEHRFEWDESARRRGRQQISQAMESLISGAWQAE
jgi:ATP-dependent helicase/nuclease subunit A